MSYTHTATHTAAAIRPDWADQHGINELIENPLTTSTPRHYAILAICHSHSLPLFPLIGQPATELSRLFGRRFLQARRVGGPEPGRVPSRTKIFTRTDDERDRMPCT